MSRKPLPLNPETMQPQQVVDQLAKLLGAAGASFGVGMSRVWEDWLSYSIVALETGLGPFREGRVPDDLAPIKAEVERLRGKYDAPHGNIDRLLSNFREAFSLWYGFSGANLYDVLGDTFMQHASPNKDAGQHFTPWHVAVMMAQINIPDGARMVFERIHAAIESLRAVDELSAVYCDAVVMTAAVVIEAEGSINALQSLLLPVLPLIKDHYEPITVNDPTCGSGNMLLAASGQFPRFAVRLGLVQFYGTDIAYVCYQMARLNEMGYGLNGYGAAAVWADLVAEGAESAARPISPPPALAGAALLAQVNATQPAEAAPAAADEATSDAPPVIPLELPAPEIRESSAPIVGAAVLSPRRKAIRTKAEEDEARQMAFTFFAQETQGVER